MIAAPLPAAPTTTSGTATQMLGLSAAPPQPSAISAIDPA
jgi:hypothetical protein